MDSIFTGYNLKYSAPNAPVTLYNYIEELSPSTLRKGVI